MTNTKTYKKEQNQIKDYYKPKLTKSGYNNNYVQYESKGDKILTLSEYFTIIEKYLRELIEEYKLKGE